MSDNLRDRIISAGISLGLLTLVGTFARCEAPPKLGSMQVSADDTAHNLYLHKR